MEMFFRSRRHQVEALLGSYRQKVRECLDAMVVTMRQFCNDSDQLNLENNIELVSSAESQADRIRREVEVLLYSKSMFPESRGDILGLIETMDKVPNTAESTVRMLRTHKVQIPDDLKSAFMKLTEVSRRCVEELLIGEELLYSSYQRAIEAVGRVNELESEADVLEQLLVTQIFDSEIDGLQKLLLRDLAFRIGSISDRSENVGDRLRVVVAKRGV